MGPAFALHALPPGCSFSCPEKEEEEGISWERKRGVSRMGRKEEGFPYTPVNNFFVPSLLADRGGREEEGKTSHHRFRPTRHAGGKSSPGVGGREEKFASKNRLSLASSSSPLACSELSMC